MFIIMIQRRPNLSIQTSNIRNLKKKRLEPISYVDYRDPTLSIETSNIRNFKKLIKTYNLC